MKKNTVIVALIASCMMSSCVKNQENMTELLGFDVFLSDRIANYSKNTEEPWLVFPSVSDYERAVDYLTNKNQIEGGLSEFEEILDYSSTRNTYSDKERDSLCVYSDILATLLNPEGKIQICDYVITIDMIRHEMSVVNNVQDEEFVVSTDNDFLEYIKGNIGYDSLKKPETNTKGVKYDSYHVVRNFMFLGQNDVEVTVDAFASNAGIIHTIESKIYRDGFFIGSNRPFLYLRVCPGGYYKYTSTGTIMGISTVTKSGTNRSYTVTSYSGTRKFDIHDYRYNVNFGYANNSTDGFVELIEVSLPIRID